jgi:hypothetical protein
MTWLFVPKILSCLPVLEDHLRGCWKDQSPLLLGGDPRVCILGKALRPFSGMGIPESNYHCHCSVTVRNGAGQLPGRRKAQTVYHRFILPPHHQPTQSTR